MRAARVIVLVWVLAAAVAACGGEGAPTATPLPTVPAVGAKPGIEVLADRYYEALNSGNINAIVTLLDQNIVMTVNDTQMVGKADVVTRLISGFSSFARYSYADARIEGNSFFATHAYEVDPERDTGLFPLFAGPIELVAQDGRITFINVGAAADPAAAAPTADPTPTAAPSGDPETLGALKSLAFEYWIAVNEYDVEKALSYLEDSYRAEREEEIAAEIEQLELFGVTLGVSERSPPTLLSPNEGEMMVNIREPLRTSRFRMGFVMVDGEWRISFVGEVR